MKKVLITGASGLFGSQLVRTFKDKRYEVLAVFNQKPDLIKSGVKKIHCNVSQEKDILSLEEHIDSFTLIIHSAAITSIDLCEKEKELCKSINIIGTKNICELASKVGASIIYISTTSVFDGKTGNYRETDIPNPIGYYNESKFLGEKHVLDYKKGVVVRAIPLGLHLENRKQASFLEWLIGSFKNNLDIDLFTDIKINPLSAETFATIIYKLPIVMNCGLIHLGSRDVVSKAQVGLEVMKFFPRYSGKIRLMNISDSRPDMTNRPREMWLNVDKALSLGFNLPNALPDINNYLVHKI